MTSNATAPATPISGVNMFGSYPQDRTHVFIDGRNMFIAGGIVGFDLDYKALAQYLKETCRFQRGNFYTTIEEGKTGEGEGLLRMLNMLEHGSYDVYTRELRTYDDSGRTKGTTDIMMAVDMFEAATTSACDHIILFSGNSELAHAVYKVKQQGTHVTVVSVTEGDNVMLGDDLWVAADEVVELATLRERFFRRERNQQMRAQVRGPVARDRAFTPVAAPEKA